MASGSKSPEGNGRDEVDGRFTELILAEFGAESGLAATRPAPTEPASAEPKLSESDVQISAPTPPSSPFSFDEAFEQVTLDPPEPYTPPELPPLRAPSGTITVALLLLIGGLIGGLILSARHQLAGAYAGLVTLSILVGLALLMARAVRRPAPEDEDDDGARV